MRNNRRAFIKAAGLTGLAGSFPFAELLTNNINAADEPGFVLGSGEQETYYIAGRQAPVTIMADKKKRGAMSISLCKEEIFLEDRIPVHKHLNETEVILIQKGSGIFTLGEKTFEVKEGSVAYVPKGIWHGLQNTGSEPITMLFSFAPSGFEGYFREIGVTKGVEWKGMKNEEWAAIDKKYGIVYKK